MVIFAPDRTAGFSAGDFNQTEDLTLDSRQHGFVNFGIMTLLVGGLALAGLLIYGAQSGQELPLWPALAVALVNVVAAAKVVIDTKRARKQPNKGGK